MKKPLLCTLKALILLLVLMNGTSLQAQEEVMTHKEILNTKEVKRFLKAAPKIKSGRLIIGQEYKGFSQNDTTEHILWIKFYRWNGDSMIFLSERDDGTVRAFDGKQMLRVNPKEKNYTKTEFIWNPETPEITNWGFRPVTSAGKHFMEFMRDTSLVITTKKFGRGRNSVREVIFHKADPIEGSFLKDLELHYFIGGEYSIASRYYYTIYDRERLQYTRNMIRGFSFEPIDSMTIIKEIDSLEERLHEKGYKQQVSVANMLARQPKLLDSLTQFPELKAMTLDGDSVSLSSYKGKLVLLDFWYKGCIPCRKSIPVLSKWQKEYGSKGLVVLGLDPLDTNRAELKSYIKEFGMDYPALVFEKRSMLKYGVVAFPTLYLLNEEGKIIFSCRGFGAPELEERLEKLIRQQLNID